MNRVELVNELIYLDDGRRGYLHVFRVDEKLAVSVTCQPVPDERLRRIVKQLHMEAPDVQQPE